MSNKKKVRLNRSWYLAPCLGDHEERFPSAIVPIQKYLPFNDIVEVEVLEDVEREMTIRVSTICEGSPGYLDFNVLKECFDVCE